MIKKLDILIIKAFIGPFIATFFITLFVLVMQFFWLYIDDLVGKGLDILTVLRLVAYVAASAVPLALPLALLLSSIMTFGNLGESFELVAIKSAGIPLLRFMLPLLIVSVCISGIAFLFANNVIPVANLKLNALKYDIIVTKPALDIKEGEFYNKLEGFVIKVGKKETDDSTIRNIVIYEKNYGLQDNMLIAKSGTMKVSPDKRFLQFKLYEGWSYQENGNRYEKTTDYIRTGFKTYKKDFDLSTFQMSDTPDSLFYDAKMLTVGQLNKAIDSISDMDSIYLFRARRELAPAFSFARNRDSIWRRPTGAAKTIKRFSDIIPDSLSRSYTESVISKISSAKNFSDVAAKDFSDRSLSLRKHQIEWNRKFTLSFACIVLFMIGAPLGSIIRKGGLGAPLLFSIIFFVIFHLLNTFGEKFSKEGVTSPAGGMWMSTLILIPISVFLVSKAMRDSQLFNQEFYHRNFKKFRSVIRFSSNKKKYEQNR
jgi:lipopolysaccharide export system permease protein